VAVDIMIEICMFVIGRGALHVCRPLQGATGKEWVQVPAALNPSTLPSRALYRIMRAPWRCLLTCGATLPRLEGCLADL
jgi:hypothetical protein